MEGIFDAIVLKIFSLMPPFHEYRSDANLYDLSLFSDWYSTNRTPTVTYSYEHDKRCGLFKLSLSQETSTGRPLHIPVKFGLLSRAKPGTEAVSPTILHLKELSQTFEFQVGDQEVVPSILREFSAPVKLIPDSIRMTDNSVNTDLAFMAAYDSDGFNKWEAAQGIFTKFIFETLTSAELKDSSCLGSFSREAFGRTLQVGSVDDINDFAMMACALTLPSESSLSEDYLTNFGSAIKLDPVAIRSARGKVKQFLARTFYDNLFHLYNDLTKCMSTDTEFKVDAESIGRRSLRNVLLDYLCSLKETPDEVATATKIAYNQFKAGSKTGMTDKLAALGALVNMNCPEREMALKQFYEDAHGDALVINKWFSVQAFANVDDVLDRVKALTKHSDFTMNNPNRCRSLISAFTMNSAKFHSADGEGYKFLGDILGEMDKLNPQISSRMAGALIQWRRYDDSRATMMRNELEKLSKLEKISDDLFEVVTRGLK